MRRPLDGCGPLQEHPGVRSAGTCPEPLSVGAGPRQGERELPRGWGTPAYSCGVSQSHPAAQHPLHTAAAPWWEDPSRRPAGGDQVRAGV